MNLKSEKQGKNVSYAQMFKNTEKHKMCFVQHKIFPLAVTDAKVYFLMNQILMLMMLMTQSTFQGKHFFYSANLKNVSELTDWCFLPVVNFIDKLPTFYIF